VGAAFLLALPLMTIMTMIAFRIEPPFSSLLGNPDPDQPDVLGTSIAVGALLLAVLAAVIVRTPIIRAIQAGGSLTAYRVNLALGIVVLFFLAMFVIGIVVDQLPCFLGVPNCD
jgi:hypothetical protein